MTKQEKLKLLQEIRDTIKSMQDENFKEWREFLIPGEENHDKCKYHEGVYAGLDRACDYIRELILKEI